MNVSFETEYPKDCNEKFAELCALATSGELNPEEEATLEAHLRRCAPCAALLREYSSLAEVGMVKLAAAWDGEMEEPFGYNERRAMERFTAALEAVRHAARGKEHSYPARRPQPLRGAVKWLGTAAMVLVAIGTAFEIGRRTPERITVSPVASNAPPRPKGDRTAAEFEAEISAARAAVTASTGKSVVLERQTAELTEVKAALLAQIAELSEKEKSHVSSLASLSEERDGLERKLTDSSTSLTHAQDELSHMQQERQGALYRVTTLETEVHDLNERLSHTNGEAMSEEKFLAADRDIRELMGARQLYIADVFDVQNNGERSQPFGRVFYTKGRSLVFYAFDLEKKPGYRETKAFQAWGKPDNASGKPISLGIFFQDDEQNRRWVVKADNPEVLSEINAVFVTVEPQGGSSKPTGKPFLEAYLHSLPPNHP